MRRNFRVWAVVGIVGLVLIFMMQGHLYSKGTEKTKKKQKKKEYSVSSMSREGGTQLQR